MNLRKWLLALVALLLGFIPILTFTGCEQEGEIPFLPSTSKLSEILIPSTPLDVFVYAKQSRPTVIPAEIAGMPNDVEVESLTIWGVPLDNNFAFGMALKFVNEDTAQKVFDQIKLETEHWKTLSKNTIFIVRGTGTAANLLQSAIENEDFGTYTDVRVLEAVQTLPNGSRAKLIAIGIAKPGKQLLDYISTITSKDDFEKLSNVLRAMDAQLVAGGLYSMYRIDIAEVVGMVNGKGSFENLDMGFLFLVKSGLPSFMFRPIMRNYLIDNNFTEVQHEGYLLYKGTWEISKAGKLQAVLRIEGSYLYAAVSGKESYAETLITNIHR